MDTLQAIMINASTPNGNGKVFDWDKAAKIIKERRPKTASAGLSEDWEWTGGTIYENGKPVKNEYTYLASRWATPILILDGEEKTSANRINGDASKEKIINKLKSNGFID